MTHDISTGAAEHLRAWAAPKPVFALMGEFSAGKSTLANFLFGESLLPENVTATNLPAVWLTYSDAPFWRGLRHDGVLEEVDFDDLGEDVRDTYLALQIGAEVELLRYVDVVDTPGLSDPKLARGATQFLDPYLDFVLWCSSAIQAWRKTEKTAWKGFSERLWANSILVLTRADKVRSARDLGKVIKRVSIETDGFFAQVLPIDTPLATEVRLRGDDVDGSETWRSSGGEALVTAIETTVLELIEGAQSDTAPASADQGTPEVLATPQKPVEREAPIALEPMPVAAPDPAPSAPPAPIMAPVADPAPVVEAPQVSNHMATLSPSKAAEKISALKLYREIRKNAGDLSALTKAKPFLDHVKVQFEKHLGNNPTQLATLKECLNAGDQGSVDAEKLLEQVELEITDFDTEGWCSLVPT